MTDYDVCVIGLGPTGLAMAHLLAQRGVRVLVLEREPEFYGMARAVYTDDECLRIMQNIGLADDLHADMTVGLPVQWVRADGSVLAQFKDPSRRNGWPTSNFLYQPSYETLLETRLADRPEVTVRRGRTVLSVEQDERSVVVNHQECAGAGYGRREPTLIEDTVEHTTVHYVVAADGGRSTVRSQLDIAMEGKSFPQRWLVLDLHARDSVEAFSHLPYFDFVCDPALPTVSCPQPGGRHRFEFMLHDDDRTEDFETVERARELLSRYVDPSEIVIDRQLVYTFNALVATRWREGRIFLAGDAAHMTPQFIGQGMNSGTRDADNLSWKLADVILRGADPALLDTYETERRPHARAMISLSVLNKDIVSTTRPSLIRARDWGLGIGTHLPGVSRFIGEAKMKPRPRFRRGAYLGASRRPGGVEGTLMPQPMVRSHAGGSLRFDDAIGAGWVVIGIGMDPRKSTGEECWSRLDPRWVALHESGSRANGRPGDSRTADDLIDLELVDRSLHSWLRRAGARDGSVIVLRPDKYVLGVLPAGRRSAAESIVATYYPTRVAT